jgi:ribose transport system substrate-binding protein
MASDRRQNKLAAAGVVSGARERRVAGETAKPLPDGGSIAEIKGLAGSTPAKERSDGFDKGIAGKNIRIVATGDGDWSRDKGQQKAAALFKAHPEVQAVYSQNDPMAEGARIAAQNAGKNDLPIHRHRRTARRVRWHQAVEAGRLSATFIYPTGGAEAIDAAKKILIDCQQVAKVRTLRRS